jgi:hypothetical protein
MIVRLMGGLGNQLWQAAFGLSVGAARGEEVFFSYTPNWRPYGLGAYQIDARLTNETSVLYREPGFTYDPGVYAAPRDATFIGYWQAWKYLNVPLVRDAMRLRTTPSNQSLRMADSIRQGESAFLHVRRGDYTQGATNAYHGMPTIEYYTAAVEYIRSRHGDVRFFVFSDEPEWVREKFPGFTIIDHNAGSPHEDIWLMSCCKHSICANSSFSFWGAWLRGNDPNQAIIAPKRWFQSADIDTRDLLPDSWIRL